MTICIHKIEQHEFEGHYSWHLTFKGVEGKGEYGELGTGIDGRGLSFRLLGFKAPWTELLPPDRFEAHPGLSGEQVAHRVAAVLVCIGWGPEWVQDRDALTRGRPVHSTVITTEFIGLNSF